MTLLLLTLLIILTTITVISATDDTTAMSSDDTSSVTEGIQTTTQDTSTQTVDSQVSHESSSSNIQSTDNSKSPTQTTKAGSTETIKKDTTSISNNQTTSHKTNMTGDTTKEAEVQQTTDTSNSRDNKTIKTGTDTVVVNSSNYDNYFNKEGYLNSSSMDGASTMVLSGSFENKLFEINMDSLTITGVDAYLENTRIYIDSDNNVISNLTINNSEAGYGDCIILSGNNCTLRDCNITDYSTSDIHEIIVEGENNTIRDNQIVLCGPSYEINWEQDRDVARTIAILVTSSGNNIIYNNISTTVSVTKGNMGTIESIAVEGSYNGKKAQNNTIEYNNIYTDGNEYAYGVTMGTYIDGSSISYNNMTSIGTSYVVGLNQFSTGSNQTIVGNNITIDSTDKGVALSIATDNMDGITDGNIIMDNTGFVNAYFAIFIDTNKITNSTISNNTGIINGINAYGINVIGEDNNITANNIKLTSLEDNAGIYLLRSNNNKLYNNTIQTNTTYTVELASTNNNNITDNRLKARTLSGSDSVNDESTGNIVANNTCITQLATTITVEDATAVYNTTVELTAHIVDEEGNNVVSGSVAFKLNGVMLRGLDGDVLYADVTGGVAILYYDSTNSPKNYSITGLYYGGDGYRDAKSESDGVLTITNRVADFEFISTNNNLKSGDTLHVSVVVTCDDVLVDDGIVIFKLNGVTLRDANGDNLQAEVVGGIASFNYTIPVGYSAKDYNLTVVYSNKYYDRLEGSSTITLIKSNVTSTIDPVEINQGEDATITATLYDQYDNQLERSTKVAIKANGKTLLNTNTTNGVLNVTIPTSTFTNPTYNLTVIFGENSAYNQLVVNTTLTVNQSKNATSTKT